jgi:hypothetical protein
MTYCDTLAKPLVEKVEIEKKSLDDIAKELCGNTVKNPRQKAIRIIKELLGIAYLQKHSLTLGYHPEKAVREKSTTDEVVKGKILTEEIENETSDNSDESESATPVSSCTARVLAVNTDVGDAGQATGQEQSLDVHDKSAGCQRPLKAVRKMRKTDSENINEGESGEMKGQEQVLEELDDAPVVNVSDELVGEIKRLIEKFSLDDVKRALAFAESSI